MDETYKSRLAEYHEMMNYAKMALNENAPMACTIREWKDDIRDMLQTIQEDFFRMIREYTRKFINSLKNIETTAKLENYVNEDLRQNERLEVMKARYEDIVEIIEQVNQTAPNLKAQTVRKVDDKMRRLEQELIAKDKEMKKMNEKVVLALDNTIGLMQLSHKIYEKYFKYIDTKVKQ